MPTQGLGHGTPSRFSARPSISPKPRAARSNPGPASTNNRREHRPEVRLMYTASNPANLRLEVGHFLKCDLKDVLILIGAIVLSGVIVAFNWKPALLVLGIGVGVVLFSIWQTRTMFQVGDVCAAMVI